MNTTLFGCGTTKSMTYEQSLESSVSDPLAHKMIQSALLVAATGLGKTVTMAALANHWPYGKVMLISHRYELNQQAIKMFEGYCGEPVAIEQANWRTEHQLDARIIVASVQTLVARRKDSSYRMEKFDPAEFGLLMIDESHRAAAASYRKVVDHFSQNPNLKIVGVTATPDRLDGTGLGCVFDKVAADRNLLWAIENGWLVPLRQKFVRIKNIDLSEVKTTAGDLDKKQLNKIMEVEENLHAMTKPMVDFCGEDKQSILFTASVRQARRSAELMRDYYHRAYGYSDTRTAVYLDGSMGPQDPRRKQIVEDFKAGLIQHLCNCDVATEGFDCPNVSVIGIGKPTKSRAKMAQMIGRGTRPVAEAIQGLWTAEERKEAIAGSHKPTCTVLDFVGQCGRHSLVHATDILAGEEPPEVQSYARRIAEKSNWEGTTMDAILEARRLVAIQKEAARNKVTVGVDYELKEGAYDMKKIPRKYTDNFDKRKVSDKQSALMVKLGFTPAQIGDMSIRKARTAIDYAIKHPRNNFGRWMKKMQQKK